MKKWGKMKKLACLSFLFCLVFSGCGSSDKENRLEEVEREKAYKAVQQADSVISGMTVVDYIQSLLNASRAIGNYVEVTGWYSVKHYIQGKDYSGYDVYFELKENEKQQKMHWIIDENNIIHPVDDLARAVSVRQKSKI